MLRRDKWWVREIERINRAHAAERAELVSTIAHLAGKPLPADIEPDPESTETEIALVVPDYLDD